jgi:D-glycero-D-manno-heptose 1,7-bisphosphate phosphatase
MRSAVFLDRDGVINKTIWRVNEWDSPIREHEARLLPGVGPAIRRLNEADFRVFVASNQPIVAKRKATEADLEAITSSLLRQLAAGGASIDAVYYCRHHPQAEVPHLRMICDCRKPAPGLIRRAATEWGIDLESSFIVGDRETDIQAGRAAGCATVLVTGRGTASAEPTRSEADHMCEDLSEAVSWMLRRGRTRVKAAGLLPEGSGSMDHTIANMQGWPVEVV